ncbi:MAG: hypothetical protein WCW33_05160 [Candidatus Babeliales bacterium]|jgi:hypothetical protein
MFKKIVFGAVLAMSVVQFCGAMEGSWQDIMEMIEPPVKDIDAFSWHCKALIKILLKQPTLPCYANANFSYQKAVTWGDFDDDAQLMELLSSNMEKKSATDLTKVYEDVWGIHYIVRRHGGLIALMFSDSDEIFALEPFDGFKKILDELKRGWSVTTREENPDIATVRVHSDKEWLLFTKKSCLRMENCLINHLANKFNLADVVDCTRRHCVNYFDDERSWPGETIFLWIKKDAFPKVKQAFKFHLEPFDPKIRKVCDDMAEEQEESAEKKSRY